MLPATSLFVIFVRTIIIMQEITFYASQLLGEFNVQYQYIRNVLTLLSEGASIPFIARYRKEMTGTMNEEVIAALQKRFQQLLQLDKRREAILESIREQEKLTPELQQLVESVKTMQELEDIYLPYKPKRRTKAIIAREKGLEPLADLIFSQKVGNLSSHIAAFISPSKGVDNPDEALAGARDIIAERIAENMDARTKLRGLFQRTAGISSKLVKGKESEAGTYHQYFDWKEPLAHMPSHRLLAVLRAENEGLLKVNVEVDDEKAIDLLEKQFVRSNGESAGHIRLAAADSWKRLLSPSLENEIRAMYKEKADEVAIRVFTENLRQLLMAPPLGQKRVLAVDPGFRTGCKIVILDQHGSLLHNETIYPHPPEHQVKQSVQKLKTLVNSYQVDVIAIGNGTAGRETEDLVRGIQFDRDLIALMVNESGASVYSASKVARDEFPDYDITVRGAVSIGRRLMDPLAELVKIDPKSIGVGQYQHDVDQKALQESLVFTVESCVNAVGVELNTASEQLLSYVSGIGSQLASNIIAFRQSNKGFRNRGELLKVPRLGEKAFEQCAGFLRIRGGENPLDASAVHPESYHIVNQIAKKTSKDLHALIGQKDIRQFVNPSDYLSEKTGMETINDILNELEKPGRDPRQQFEMFEFSKDVRNINDLKPGMELNGIVTNITAFGAFVDIGVHQDGLVHVSQMADRFIRDPNQVVKLNQKVRVQVVAIDIDRNRISLTMKLGKLT